MPKDVEDWRPDYEQPGNAHKYIYYSTTARSHLPSPLSSPSPYHLLRFVVQRGNYSRFNGWLQLCDSTSGMPRGRTCFSSSTTSSGSPRQERRCRLFWAVSPPPWATSPPSPPTWVCSRSVFVSSSPSIYCKLLLFLCVFLRDSSQQQQQRRDAV